MLYIDDMIDVYCMLDGWWMVGPRGKQHNGTDGRTGPTDRPNEKTDRLTDG